MTIAPISLPSHVRVAIPSGAPDSHRMIDPTAHFGQRCVVWAFARILGWVSVGDDVSIGGGTEVGRSTVIGHRSRIGANCFLPSHSTIGDDVFVGPGTTFTDDRYPKVNPPGTPYTAEPPIVEHGARIGAGCVILPGVRIGAKALIGAGSTVTKDVPAGAHFRGEPAREKTLTGS